MPRTPIPAAYLVVSVVAFARFANNHVGSDIVPAIFLELSPPKHNDEQPDISVDTQRLSIPTPWNI
ncbi:hypothetical protein [Rhizobium mayense]|uniref:Uncharacterized protein n=1 Tax=Rhizobium mayense TaxID=1312184 RepID=A0ABT7JNQ0_9HYPH|nr:hypothetical protein [Rhizobium mayense]MDL2397975.1 hypothetical protein [Rhizobium mayense]